VERLGQFAGGVAHDFNHLLCAIVNYAEFINDEMVSANRWPVLADREQVEQVLLKRIPLTGAGR
jgi:hypothetical protein